MSPCVLQRTRPAPASSCGRCRPADGRCRATADGRKATNTSPSWRARPVVSVAPPRDVDPAVDRVAAVEVEPDQPGDVVGARPGGDLAPACLSARPAVLETTSRSASTSASSGSWVTTTRRAVVAGQVAAQVGADLQPGAGVQRGERLVEQQQRGSGARARASATRWACPPESCRRPLPGVLGEADPRRASRPPSARPPPGRCRGRAARRRRCPARVRCGKSR